MTDRTPINDDELQVRLNLSSAGGKLAMCKEIGSLILNKAGNAFAAGSDVEAKILRDLAHVIKLYESHTSEDLERAHAALNDLRKS